MWLAGVTACFPSCVSAVGVGGGVCGQLLCVLVCVCVCATLVCVCVQLWGGELALWGCVG